LSALTIHIRPLGKQELALQMSGAQTVAAEWQRLMKQWDSACIAYAAACQSAADTLGPEPDPALDQARHDLTEIKRQMDSLIATCARARAASTEPLRFAFLDMSAKRIVTMKSPKGSVSDQAFPRYSKR
jgi:hypothetical protein